MRLTTLIFDVSGVMQRYKKNQRTKLLPLPRSLSAQVQSLHEITFEFFLVLRLVSFGDKAILLVRQQLPRQLVVFAIFFEDGVVNAKQNNHCKKRPKNRGFQGSVCPSVPCNCVMLWCSSHAVGVAHPEEKVLRPIPVEASEAYTVTFGANARACSTVCGQELEPTLCTAGWTWRAETTHGGGGLAQVRVKFNKESGWRCVVGASALPMVVFEHGRVGDTWPS